MDEIKLKNRALSSPGLAIKGGSASPLVSYGNSFAFLANGLVSPTVSPADAPSLALATTLVPNSTVAGNLASDNGSVNTNIKCQRIYTLVATLPTNDGSTAPTFSWLAGADFTKYEFPSVGYVALPNQENQAVIGYLVVKNAGAVNFVPGTTNLDATNVTSSFIENSILLGTGSALASALMWVGNGGGTAGAVAMSGDATLSNTGAVTLASDVKSKTVKVSLTSVNILALNTTPIELVPAPATGHVLDIQSVVARMNFLTGAYATNTELDIIDGVAGTKLFFDTANVLGATSTKVFKLEPAIASNGANLITSAGNVTAKVLTGNPTTGAGTLDLYVTYRDITL